MSNERSPLRLSAIIAADVVGYTKLMEQDTEGTVAAWKAARADIIDPTITEYSGHIVKHTGDGFLAEFSTVQDAVKCAVAMQERLNESPLDFRMGINLGDIIDDGEDIHGEGVNIAARIEALSQPGEICISGSVFEQVRNRLDQQFEDQGEHEVKHVSSPVRVYRVVLDAGSPVIKVDAALPDKSSIAVLPFDNMSGDPEQQYFADGISEDIITALSKVSRLRVVARNSSFAYKGKFSDVRKIADELGVRYVLEGSVRRGGSRIRVTAQLIDASVDTHLWAERYDRNVDDVFDIQDEIAKEIVTHLRVQLTDGESALMFSRGTDNVEAWQYCIRAQDLWLRLNTSDHLAARKFAKQAIELDPDYAAAWAILGWTYHFEGKLGIGGNSENRLKEAREVSERAIALDENNAWAIGLYAHTTSALGQQDGGVEIAWNGLNRLPGSADVRSYLSYALMHAARYDEAIENFQAAIALNPLAPNWYLGGYSRTLLCMGRFEECLDVTDRILADEPDFHQAWLYRAFIYQQTAQDLKAHQSMAEAMRLAPNFKLPNVPTFFLEHKDPELLKRLTETLRRAGLPE